MQSYIHKVQFYETDKMGIAHHSNYFRWMEEARGFFMEQLGCPYEKMDQEGVGSVVTDAECRFINFTSYGDEVEIKIWPTEYRGNHVKINYEMYIKSSGKLAATGSTSHSFIQKEGIFRMKKRYPEFDAALSSAVSERSSSTNDSDKNKP